MAKNAIHTEDTFEGAILQSLTSNGWQLGSASNYSKDLALDKEAIFHFIATSQPKEWEKLHQYYKGDTKNKFIQRLYKELDLRGMIDVVRHGITDSGIKFKLAYFKPDSTLNPDTLAQYQHNTLYVTQQVYFSTQNNKSIDLLLSLNGLPLATIELKNHFTGQTANDALIQYKTKRDPKELLFQFKKRAIVHFTIDADTIYLATKLRGTDTRFIPFNKGYNNGAGNPPTKNYTTYRTAYFWEEILQPDSWLEIVGRFIHLQKEERTVDGKKYTSEKILFPRYHQLDAVRKINAHTLQYGAGKNYLIQHSAGSGKSNTIAWLSYRLSSLYNSANEKVFDAVIVITDRNVLDWQLQNTIYQFEHKQGVVAWIEKDSTQLAEAINAGTGIVITTLQKFPFALDKIQGNTGNKYAVIIDEAHSSQGGEASRKMTEALAGKNIPLEEAEAIEGEIENNETNYEDYIQETLSKQGPQQNISLFAFTATPKAKTLEVFGIPDAEGKPSPFHHYSMRQAIEEGFILDVLKNYTTYKQYYRFSKAIEDDPQVNKTKAAKAIGRFASLHPTNIAQKTEIMVEHFRQMTMHKIGGKAKAIVVTASRKHALRYYLAFKEYIEEKDYKNIRPLVAFSGAVIDDGYPDGITEAALNGFGEKELPEKFDKDDYRVLLVADKYQTGFDQPLLHTMYVDKKLSGVKAVQTLSRLNRTTQGKEDTFILDFTNERDDIIASFQPYYEVTNLAEYTDPNHLYDLKGITDATNVYYQSEIDGFAKIFYKPGKVNPKDQGKLYAFIDPSIDRYKELEIEVQDEFKKALSTFIRLYSYLIQIMPFQDIELEKLYAFGRFLLSKLPKSDFTDRFTLDNEVALEYYRLQKIAEGDLVLQIQGDHSLEPTTEAGISREKEEKDKLSNIIKILNDRFNTDFTDADRLYFEQLEQALLESEDLQKRAKNNPYENFKLIFNEAFIQTLIERMDSNQDIFEKIMEHTDFRDNIVSILGKSVYKNFNTK